MSPLPHHTEVLVLGAGLAGLRAAMSAAQSGAKVLLATASTAPSGSSFANRNGRLGMQVPLTEEEREQYLREATTLARPGFADPTLVGILARESEERLQDLLDLGAKVLENPDGSPRRQRACFSPHERAVVLTDLPGLFSAMWRAAGDAGCDFLPGVEVLGLMGDGRRAHGAWVRKTESGETLFLRARAVVMALGGPAPLFSRHTAGPGTPGYGWALLDAAGAALANTEHLQCMWLSPDKGKFLSPAHLAGPDARVHTPDGEVSPPEEVFALAESRAEHCPTSHRLPDAAMDRWLAEHADEKGVVRVRTGDEPWREAALFAHAGNGGAVIDEWGATTVAGLYAAGECATGMHGADRLGGGMVAATQVFGHRAGQDAARFAIPADEVTDEEFEALCLPFRNSLLHHPDDEAALAEGRSLLTPEAVCIGRDRNEIRTALARLSRSASSWRTLLDARARLLLVR